MEKFIPDSITHSFGAGPEIIVENINIDDHVVGWKVRCINTQTKQLFDRELMVRLGDLPTEVRHGVSKCCQMSPVDDGIVRYRSFFKEVTIQEFVAAAEKANRMTATSVMDYFEDENGNPLGSVELMEVLSGRKTFVILGNVESVTRLGPAPMTRKELWTVNRANNIDHLFRVVKRIVTSEWWRSDLSIKYLYQPGTASPNTRIGWKHPSLPATREILLAIRQLYSHDDLFNFACKGYLAHVDHSGKQLWVKDRKTLFNKILSDEANYPKIENYTGREVLDLFMYGSGEVHRISDSGLESRFNDAVNKYEFPHVYTSFAWIARQLVGIAGQVCHVVMQDFEHWLKNEGVSQPDRATLEDHM